MLIGKAVVFTSWSVSRMTIASLAAFLVAQAVLSGHRPTATLADASTLRVVIGTGVYLTLVGLLGSALAWIVRSTPGALVATLALILVLPILFELVFPSWGTYIGAYLPDRRRPELLHQPRPTPLPVAVGGAGRDGRLGGRGDVHGGSGAQTQRRVTPAAQRVARRAGAPPLGSTTSRPG